MELQMKRQLTIGMSLLIAAVLCIGCGSSYTRTDNGSIVQVQEDEYHINMPSSFASGVVTFHVLNTGEHKHSFKIKGNGVEQELPSGLSTLETGEMTATLTPGTYEVSCPMLGHSLLGMHLTVTATPR
jgi:septal ring-binding cell division protein DamX